jgi:hypothetical protein
MMTHKQMKNSSTHVTSNIIVENMFNNNNDRLNPNLFAIGCHLQLVTHHQCFWWMVAKKIFLIII